MTETITDIAELERRIRVVKLAVMKRARETGTDNIPWSDPAYPDYCRRGRKLVAEMQAQVAALKEKEAEAEKQAHWRHALDLAKDRTVDELLATRHLTDDKCILNAVEFHLEYPEHYEANGRDRHRQCLSVATARRILDAIGILEPEDRSEAAILGDGLHSPPGVADISVNHLVANAWIVVHGIEDGWMKRDRAGFLSLSEKAVEGRRAAKVAADVPAPIAETPEPAAWTTPAWVRSEEDDGVPLQAIADALPNRHATAWMEERQRLVRLATASVPPFEACVDLGRNLGASVQIRATEDGEAWEVAHDCEWGGGGYVAPFRGRHVTRRGAFSVAAKAIRAKAQIPLDAVKDKDVKLCVGAQDVLRCKRIIRWLDGLEAPGPDEVGQERASAKLDGPIVLREEFGRKGEDYALIDVRPRDGGGWLVAHECHLGTAAGYWAPAGARNSDPFADAHAALEHAVFSIDWLIAAHPEKKAAPKAGAWLAGIAARFGIDVDSERVRRSTRIAKFEEDRILQQKEIEANRPRIDPTRDLVSLDVGHLGATVEARPIQDGLWLAVAGYRYSGVAGYPAHDGGIGRFPTSEEALAAGVAFIRKGADGVLSPDFGNDVPAAAKKRARATIAWCDAWEAPAPVAAEPDLFGAAA